MTMYYIFPVLYLRVFDFEHGDIEVVALLQHFHLIFQFMEFFNLGDMEEAGVGGGGCVIEVYCNRRSAQEKMIASSQRTRKTLGIQKFKA